MLRTNDFSFSDDTLRQWFLTVSRPRLPQSNRPLFQAP